jgi:FAD-dependent urate hydroxylase
MVLAQCLRDINVPEQAFAAFERARRSRVEAIVKQSRRNGSSKAVSGPLHAWLRDRVLPLFLQLGATWQGRQYAFRIDWPQRYA